MSAQLWRCPACGLEYWSPMAVAEAKCPGPHSPAGSRQMELVADGDEADAASPFTEEAAGTVRRGSRKEGR